MAWQRLEVVVDGRHAEALGEALEEEGALATEITDADAGTDREQAAFGEPGAEATPWPRALVSALFPVDSDPAAVLDAALGASGVETLGEAAIERIEDTDWVALTQRQFTPLQVGVRLWIVPTWHAPPDPLAVNVILDPGAAFGTGSHPTTRLCLGWLERHVRAGDALLDYGCGSGILAIAALKLGAGRAAGVDVDPVALETARYNSASNGVRLETLDANAAPPFAADITVANILANPLRMLAPLIATHTRAGGWIVLSGILEDQAEAVGAAYAPWVRLDIAGRDSGWVLLAGEREA
ncbi:MAG: 50S ribosomal protein L11 methyltransferase [Pseudomonadota bacterium]|nr:50S ribosomal protein L11 methyltransferase [Pseudomonadota bacterium]